MGKDQGPGLASLVPLGTSVPRHVLEILVIHNYHNKQIGQQTTRMSAKTSRRQSVLIRDIPNQPKETQSSPTTYCYKANKHTSHTQKSQLPAQATDGTDR
jgi:hypothetical protein